MNKTIKVGDIVETDKHYATMTGTDWMFAIWLVTARRTWNSFELTSLYTPNYRGVHYVNVGWLHDNATVLA